MSIFRATFLLVLFLACVARAGEPKGANEVILPKKNDKAETKREVAHTGLDVESNRLLQSVDLDFHVFTNFSSNPTVTMWTGTLDHSFVLGHFEPFYRASLTRLDLGITLINSGEIREGVKGSVFGLGFGLGFDVNIINILEKSETGIFSPYVGLVVVYNMLHGNGGRDSRSNPNVFETGINMVNAGIEVGGKYFFKSRMALKLAFAYEHIFYATVKESEDTSTSTQFDLTKLQGFNKANRSFGFKSGIILYF